MADVSTLDTATRGHHPDSPSSLQPSEACPLFENEQRESQASKNGVLQHHATEIRDTSVLGGNQEWVDAVNECIALEDEVIESLCEPCVTHEGSFEGRPTVIREKYLHVGDDEVVDAQGHKWVGVTGGYPDTLVISASRKRAAIIDYKFGAMPVAKTAVNLQGKAYALATLQAFPELEFVKVIFFAPHQKWDAEYQKKHYEHTFDREFMPEMENHIRTVIARKHAARKALHEHGDWSAANPCHDLCCFCALKGQCAKNIALTIQAHSKYEGVTLPDSMQYVDVSTPEQVEKLYRTVQHLEPVLKAAKKFMVESALRNPSLLPKDWKLISRQDRSIESLDAAIEAAKRHGVSKKEVLETMSIPISKLEELVKSKAQPGMGAAAVRGFADTLESMGAVTLGTPVYSLKAVKTPAEKTGIERAEMPTLNI